ncbi:flagellar hook-length control protein FliK [Caulobacter sp.]|uniref:flagellar hook-length control protein FliK n=1 Tax=Caulobacter sp. TaxID=78 RepID=UPI002B49AD24|nr:flagellar hook-length control protein FliK [Caulobacter sp.]HJV41238.1 flagellar hook-length control protein FliK [Caulobacter sp.]
MAIDPTTPVTPTAPAAPAGSPPSSAVALQAMARAAMAGATAQLGEIVGQPTASTFKTHSTVEQPGQASAQDAGRATDTPAAKGGAVEPGRAPVPDVRSIRAVRVAAADAVPRQAGLAPLMADVREIVERAETPSEVRNAGKTLLARVPRAFEISTAQGLRKAVERSGVFLEARLARGDLPKHEGAAPSVAPETDIKAALLVFRSVLSNWLARTAPPPTEEPEHPGMAAPEIADHAEGDEPVRSGPAQSRPVQSEHVETESPHGVARPEAQSGGAPLADAESPQTAAPRRDDSAALAPPAKETVSPPLDDAVEPRFAAFLASPKPVRPPTTKPEAPALGLLGMIEATPDAEDLARSPPSTTMPLAAKGYGPVSAEQARSKTPPPPFAGGPLAGQRPTGSDLPPEASAQAIVRRLVKGAGAALARQDLMQIASLPEVHHDPETGEARPQAGRLNLEVPFVTPQGVAVAQFEISHDGGGAGGGAVGTVERTYRVRFSIDVEPLGPVHALVTLTGARTRVSLWAERAETIARLRAGEESLGAALRQADLSPDVAVHSGAPPIRDTSVLGHFVDQAS